MRKLSTELVDLRIRVSEKKRERLKILKTEFGFKSMSKLVNIFIDSGFERIEDKFHFVDKAQGDEIKKIVMQIANDVRDMKIIHSRIGSNVNQIARVTNMGVAITSNKASSSPDVFLKREIDDLEKKIADLEKSGTGFNEFLLEQYRTNLAKKKAKLQPQIQQNIDVSAGVNVSVDDIQALKDFPKELTEASEKLGKELWKILS